jgi:hypothetical protein
MYNPPPFHRRGADHFRGNDFRPNEAPRPPIRRDRFVFVTSPYSSVFNCCTRNFSFLV